MRTTAASSPSLARPLQTTLPKRKHQHHSDDVSSCSSPAVSKKARLDGPTASAPSPSPPPTRAPAPTTTASGIPHPLVPIFTSLQDKYETKLVSVLSSSKLHQRVDTILAHLGRFHAWDRSVLPGVVMLYLHRPTPATANKLASVAGIVRRRIHESEQKWYQYNMLFDMDAQEHAHTPVTAKAGYGDEVFQDEVFQHAVDGRPPEQMMASLSIFLSRVPVAELGGQPNFTTQTNEEAIELMRRKKTLGY